MVKIQILATSEFQEVTRNIAHDLIDRGLARLASQVTRQEERQIKDDMYLNRQMRSQIHSVRGRPRKV